MGILKYSNVICSRYLGCSYI